MMKRTPLFSCHQISAGGTMVAVVYMSSQKGRMAPVPLGMPVGLAVAPRATLVKPISPVVMPLTATPLFPMRTLPAGNSAFPIVVTMLCSLSSATAGDVTCVPPVVEMSMKPMRAGALPTTVCAPTTAVKRQTAIKPMDLVGSMNRLLKSVRRPRNGEEHAPCVIHLKIPSDFKPRRRFRVSTAKRRHGRRARKLPSRAELNDSGWVRVGQSKNLRGFRPAGRADRQNVIELTPDC